MFEKEKVFEEYKPYLVFHAAAHKHVPLMEVSPLEAIKNNVFGTYNVANCADKYKAKKMILISTDKAGLQKMQILCCKNPLRPSGRICKNQTEQVV